MTKGRIALARMQRPGRCPGLSLFMLATGRLAEADSKHPIHPAKDGTRTGAQPVILEIDHRCALELKQETEGVGDVRLCDQGLNLPKRSV